MLLLPIGNFDHWAHIGGFVCGLLFARWLAPDREHYLEYLYNREA